MRDIQRFGTTQRYSNAVVHGRTAYLVEVADNLEADITGQTENVLAKIDCLLGDVGSNKSLLLTATIYLASMADYADMNMVWDLWVPEGEAPVRACMEVKLSAPGYRIEIAATAAIDHIAG